MDKNRFKSAAAMATIGMGTLLSANAMANDIDVNQKAYDGMQSVQQHVASHPMLNFDTPSLKMETPSPSSDVEDENLKDEDKSKVSNEVEEDFQMSKDDLSVGTSLEGQISGVDVQEKETVEICDPNAPENTPSLFAKMGSWVVKIAAGAYTLQTGGFGAALGGHAVYRAAEHWARNGCDEIDLKEEGYEAGKEVVDVLVGGGVQGMVVSAAIDYGKGKYDKAQAQKAEEKRQAEEAAAYAAGVPDPEIAEISVVQTSETSEVYSLEELEDSEEVSNDYSEDLSHEVETDDIDYETEPEPEEELGITINKKLIDDNHAKEDIKHSNQNIRKFAY